MYSVQGLVAGCVLRLHEVSVGRELKAPFDALDDAVVEQSFEGEQGFGVRGKSGHGLAVFAFKGLIVK